MSPQDAATFDTYATPKSPESSADILDHFLSIATVLPTAPGVIGMPGPVIGIDPPPLQAATFTTAGAAAVALATTAAAAMAALGSTTVSLTLTLPSPTPLTMLLPAPTTTGLPPAATQSPGFSGGPGGTEDGQCHLLGPFALVVQLALGALALLSLVWKRWRERPQRPMKVWFFDASKQVVGSVLVHIANVFLSMLTSGKFSIKVGVGTVVGAGARAMMLRRHDELDWAWTVGRGLLGARSEDDGVYVPNPCSFYLLNLGIDTTLGIPILIVLVRLTTILASYTALGDPPESIQSGNYGYPPNAVWWLKQALIYFIGLFGMKVVVLILFLAFPWLARVGDWALKWTEGNERLQIAFVMMLFPLIMNAFQYYVIDTYIKKRAPADEVSQGHVPIPSDDDDDTEASAEGDAPRHHRYDDPLPDSDDDDDVDVDDLVASTESLRLNRARDTGKAGETKAKAGAATAVQQVNLKPAEYDPEVDGDSQTVVGSGASRRTERGQIIPKELYPRE